MLPRSLPTSIRARGVTAVLGPTNTGKTHLAIERMIGHGAGLIGLPLRLLAADRCHAGKVRLVGAHRRGDVSRVTTTWLFRADGICGRSIVTESVSAGTTPTLRVGTCRAAGTGITVLFTEEASAFTMVYDFPNLATLTLDGLPYELAASP